MFRNDNIRRILGETRTIAAVGASTNETRPSYYVLRYLVEKGYRVIPVNPRAGAATLFGEPVVASLADIPDSAGPVDMVEIFRAPAAAPGVVAEALAALAHRGLSTIWMQLGVVSPAAAERARSAGLSVVMDRCPKIEYARQYGELGWGGFNTGIISSRRPTPARAG